jgi:uncharacterized protein (TIGR03000 family)
MFRQIVRTAGVPAVFVGALLMAGPARAQHGGGGGHGGGSHGGGFSGGSFRGGSPSGGFHHGGSLPGSVQHGGFHHDGFHDHGFHYHGFRGGFFPGFYYDYYPPYGYFSPYDLGYRSTNDPGYFDSYTGVTPSTASPNNTSAQVDSTAHITVMLPANAELWFGGTKTTSVGSVREFQSPPLTPGQYTYEIRGRWTENGHDITNTQEVTVSPRAHVIVNLQIGSGTD